jgi:putative phage-type endonuclease
MMSAIVKLVQGSPEWHAHRAQYRNASETAIVMGVSPWQTPFQLWELRTGRRQQTANAAMARGTALEPQARAAYEALTGHVMQPLVLIDGDYSASLDGLTFDKELLVEIKCPMKGKDSILWRQVANGDIPAYYILQMEHQFMVSKARKGHLYVFDGNEGLLLEVSPCPERWPAIREAWDGFMNCIATDTPPPLQERDKIVRDDTEWRAAAAQYLALKAQADALSDQLDEAKAALLALSSHPSESGCGVTVTRFWKQGSVDYKQVPELRGLDLDPYRKKGGFETRVTVAGK